MSPRYIRYIFLTSLMLLLLHPQTTTARTSHFTIVKKSETASSIPHHRTRVLPPFSLVAAHKLPMSIEHDGYSLTVLSSGAVLLDEVLQTGSGTEHISLLDIDLNNPNIRLGLVLAHDRLVSPDEPLSSMANRTNALAGINGDYFEIHGPGRPIGMMVSNGQLLQTPTNDSFYAVLGVTSTGRLTIGPEFFSGSIIDGTSNYPLHEINIYGDIRKGPILITPDLGTGISVAGDTVVMLHPIANSSNTFTVQSVQTNATWLPALSGQDAIIGQADDAYWLASHLHPHDKIRLTEQISPDSNLLQAIGGGPIVLQNGELYDDPHPPAPSYVYVREPITAIGVTRDGTHALLAVFDGRGVGPWKSVGVTYSEAATYLQAYGVYNAMLFDTGGSTELVTRFPGHKKVSIINWPSDGQERPVANGLFVYTTGITYTTHIPCKPCSDH